ncbi:MAG: 50S ribosomal protein L35 [Acidimicrobiia bacterium]|nr:50S ribosomal protein L35 [Acidimicrobiia bacterium]
MPKQKTHKGGAKRFKTTGTGKIRRRKSWRGHNRHKKRNTRWARSQGDADVNRADLPRVRKMLGR